MADSLVLSVVIGNALVWRPVVGNNKFRFWMRIFLDEGMKGAAISAFNLAHSHVAATLNDSGKDGFVALWASPYAPYAALFPAHKRLVYLYCPAQFARIKFTHYSTDAMAEIPRGFIGHAKNALHLIRRHAFLGFYGKVNSDKPLLQRQVRWPMGSLVLNT
jgi:hypothetical protein